MDREPISTLMINRYATYLTKQQFQLPTITTKPKPNLGLVVVIPVHNEPNIELTLTALASCTPPKCDVEVLLVFNASVDDTEMIKDQNNAGVDFLEHFKANYKGPLVFHTLINNGLPPKHAGVGLARKIGMDEAINRFLLAENEEGIICCFDADATCTDNYLEEVYNHFQNYPSQVACSIHFEHPIAGKDFSPDVYEYIIDYELHLRVYKNALKYAGLPYAYHTVGSSMAVKAIEYCKQGGMNKRKAGEDFYFLQKFIQLGSVGELTTTRVIPSPRVSDRVPFGTGRAIGERMESKSATYNSYAMDSFHLIKNVVDALPKIYLEDQQIAGLPSEFLAFYSEDKLLAVVQSVRNDTTNYTNFVKRFYRFFDAFQVLKFVHYLRDFHYPNQPVGQVAKELLHANGLIIESTRNEALLNVFRKIDINQF
jgi:hypothetical protein